MVIMQKYCGKIIINHKTYRAFFDVLDRKFIFYNIIHDDLYKVNKDKVYTHLHNSSNFENAFGVNTTTPYKVRHNPFNKTPFTPSLSEEEYELLLTALDRNPYLKKEDKKQIKWFKSLILGKECDIKKLYERYANLRIFKIYFRSDIEYLGFYVAAKNALYLNLSFHDTYEFTKIHELTHLHQYNDTYNIYLYEWFIEGMTEIASYEILRKHYDADDIMNKLCFGYIHEVNVCNILCEIFNPQDLHKLTLFSDQTEIESYFKRIMTEEEFYEIFGKMTLYYNQISFNHLDTSKILSDVYETLSYLALRICPKHSENIQNILDYLDAVEDQKIHFIKNYIIPDEKSTSYQKRK